MWGFGCLIWEIFNGPLPRSSSLKSTSKVGACHFGGSPFPYVDYFSRFLNLLLLITVNLLVPIRNRDQVPRLLLKIARLWIINL